MDSWFGSAFPDFYHSTFHRPDYVIERWGWFFDVHGYLPRHALGHQDVVILERRAGDLPAGSPPTGAAATPTAPPKSARLEQLEALLAAEPMHEGRSEAAGAVARRALRRVMRQPRTATTIDRGAPRRRPASRV